jgi:hypothetical protein
MKRRSDRYEVHRLTPGANARSARIYSAISHICSGETLIHILSDTPEQCEDIIVALVGTGQVVRFELGRGGAAIPTAFETWSVRDYQSKIGQGRSALKLEAAILAASLAQAGQR